MIGFFRRGMMGKNEIMPKGMSIAQISAEIEKRTRHRRPVRTGPGERTIFTQWREEYKSHYGMPPGYFKRARSKPYNPNYHFVTVVPRYAR